MTRTGHYYSLLLLLWCYLFLRTTALNETDYQFNETVIGFYPPLISLTNDSFVVNATAHVPTDNVTESSTVQDVSTVLTVLNSTVPFSSPVHNATDTTLLDITTAGASSQSESIDNNTTLVYTSVFTTDSSDPPSTTAVTNTSCESSKYGCCADGITARDGKVLDQGSLPCLMISPPGPDNQGCADEGNSTISYESTRITNEIDVISTEEPDSTIQVTEETTEASFTDIPTENTTFVTVDTDSTVFDDNTTAVELDNTTTVELENTTAVELDNTTATQPLVETTTELVETTTLIETTVALPTTCAESKFQCCPDGSTFAQVVRSPSTVIELLVCVPCRALSSKDAIRQRSGQQQKRVIR